MAFRGFRRKRRLLRAKRFAKKYGKRFAKRGFAKRLAKKYGKRFAKRRVKRFLSPRSSASGINSKEYECLY